MKKARRFLGLLILAVIGLALGKGYVMLRNISPDSSPLSVLDTMRDPRGQLPDKDRLNILLIGKDYNHTNKGILYTKQARSDTLILLSLDLERRRVSALSIPRDTYIPSRRGKINAAYTEGGAPLSMKTVGELLGVRPDYYIALKPDAVKQLVDRLGGVTVEAKDRMKYDDNWGGLHIDLPAGRYAISGEQAVGFTRFRKSNPGEPKSEEEGDDRRMARQQMLLKAMTARAKEPQMLLHADKLIDAALDAVETDLERNQLLAIAALFRNIQPEQMLTGSLMGSDGRVRGLYVFRPDERKMKAQVDWLLKGDEAAAYRLTTVAVQNGTEIAGAARHVADLLRDEGFDAKNAGNAARPEPAGELGTTRIVYAKAAVAARAQKIAELLGGGTLVKDTPQNVNIKEEEEAADVTIVLGRDLASSFLRKSARL